MFKKRWIALLMASALTAGVLVGCGENAGAGTAGEAVDAAVAVEETVTEAAVEEETPAAEETEPAAAEAQDITDIRVQLLDFGFGDNAGPIIDAMNEITEREIGVHADIIWSPTSSYSTDVSLAIAGGEQIDLISIAPMAPTDFTSLMSNGQLMDITDLMEEYAPETLAMMDKYISADSIDGRIYGVPVYRNYAASTYLIMRKDILDDLGLTEKARNAKTWTEIEEIFDAVASETEAAPCGSGLYINGTVFNSDSFDESVCFDNLGDAYRIVFTDNDGNVSFLMDEPAYRDMEDRVKSWWDKGYIYKDALTTDEGAQTLMKAGVIFSLIQTSELGVESAYKQRTGYDNVCIEIAKSPLGSLPVQRIGMGVPITAEEPEAAVEWMNFLYNSPELQNLLTWGIEGEDYVVRDGVAYYPEGVSAADARYHEPDFMFGNYFNNLPWDGNTADFRETAKAYLEAYPVSPYMGFTADQKDLTNTVAAINSVYQEYNKQLWYGAFDDSIWDECYKDLKVAGVDTMLEAYQEQLNAWMAAN